MKCCWVCVPCRENQYMKNEYTCENCPIGWRPSNNLTGCLQIPVKYIQWSETPSLVAIAISVIGLLMTLFTMFVFIKVFVWLFYGFRLMHMPFSNALLTQCESHHITRPSANHLNCRLFSFQHNKTPVVKASTKELSYLIMIGNAVQRCLTFCFSLLKFYSHILT